MTVVDLPELCLVALVGTSGAGKSTFAARHFTRYEIVSSDVCRGLVGNDENDQSVSAAAFEVLGHIVRARLRLGHLTVIDATNVTKEARRQVVDLAREHDVLPVAIVLDVPEAVARERNRGRSDRSFGSNVIRRQHDQLRQSLRNLQREGFRRVIVLRGVDEVEAATVTRSRLNNDLRHEHGPFDVIGDIHGCRSELETLLRRLGYEIVRDDEGRAVDAAHPEGRRAIFVGDYVDRGPDSPGVLRIVMGMTRSGNAFAVPGNHENKLVRALDGARVQVSHGLERTLEQLAAETPQFRAEVRQWCYDLVSHLVFDDGRLVVAHAGLKEAYHGRTSGRVRSFALYGDTTGETDEFGLPVRLPWANDYRGRAMVLYGHVPTPVPEWVNNTMCLDTGCVFGGQLTALRYPEREVISVPAEQVWYEPVKPFPVAGERDSRRTPTGRAPDQLDLTDVVGKRAVDTAHHGRVSVRAEQAAGALEVISRFALHPRWLPYLPPTMAPSPTSRVEGHLEHPAEALRAFADLGVEDVICEEKHMGSRAVLLVCRSAEVAERRFGDGSRTGVVYSRTGRSLLSEDLTEELLRRVRSAVGGIGLWDELGTDWLLLDAEVLPWSLKAEELLRRQYAPVGAAARAMLGAAGSALTQAAERGLEVSALLAHTAVRADAAERFTAAYRRYCWAVEGLAGVSVAPFQVLAVEGRAMHDVPHEWHLRIADRLLAADAGLFRSTRRTAVRTNEPAAVEEATQWWVDLTASGGEGMVVKPAGNLTRTAKGLVPAGLKVRGRDYLRIIYGPDYTLPEHLDRLRARELGRKRSLALREYALGIEALDRFVAGEPLWRVHEAVFAVLALESDPVDPRL